VQTDIIIVGKGIAALVLAFLLKQKGISPVLLDRKAKIKHLDLAETLPPSALPLLHNLGLYNLFEKHSIRKTYGYHSLWGSDRLTNHNFYFHHPYKYGLKINKKNLLTNLEELSPSTTFQYEQSLNIQKKQQGWSITFSEDGKEKTLHTSMLIDATGRNRAVLKLLNIPVLNHDANLSFTCHLPKKKHPDLKHSVFVESFKEGWGLVSGLNDLQNVVSIFTHKKSPIFKEVSSYQNWKKIFEATKYLKHFLVDDASIKVAGKMANSSRPEKIAGDHWLAIGDAALAFDPLCSHGISNAIYTAMQAAAAIINKLKDHENQPALTGEKKSPQSINTQTMAAGVLQKESFENYHTTLVDIFNAYLVSKKKLYQQEARWKSTIYWSTVV